MSPTASDMRRLGYLSGAPRVTTRSDGDAPGPRAHVLGVIGGFEHAGWTVSPYIVGDRMPAVVSRDGERMLSRGRAWTLGADAVRLAMRHREAFGAWRTLRGKVDWVYERFALFQALGRPFARRGIPWIIETNALLTDEASRERGSVVLTDMARRMEHGAYRHCDAVVAVSETLKQRLVESMGVPHAKVLVVPNGVDVTRFDPARVVAKRPVELTRYVVVFVGSLAAWQGLDTLLRAVRALGETAPMDIVVLGDGPERPSLDRLARELGIASRVHFMGRVPPEDIPGYLAGADAGYAGHTDASGTAAFRSPLKLYEYLAMGKVVVTSDVADARATVRPGETGYLFAPNDVGSLARALSAAYTARERGSQAGAQGRLDIVAHHSWDARVRTIIGGVEGLLAQRGPDADSRARGRSGAAAARGGPA